MESVIVLLIVNLIAGCGCAVPVARFLVRVDRKPMRMIHCFAIVVGMYFLECVSVAVGMGIPVFSVGLAFVWGVVFSLWLRSRGSVREILKMSFVTSLYTCLPAVSVMAIPVMAWVDGKNIVSVEEAVRFGVPELPPVLWPVCTILGFYGVLAAGAVLFKTVITTGEVSLFIHCREWFWPGTASEAAAHE